MGAGASRSRPPPEPTPQEIVALDQPFPKEENNCVCFHCIPYDDDMKRVGAGASSSPERRSRGTLPVLE